MRTQDVKALAAALIGYRLHTCKVAECQAMWPCPWNYTNDEIHMQEPQECAQAPGCLLVEEAAKRAR